LTILKKAEFEKEIKDAIEKTIDCYANVQVKEQIVDDITTITLEVSIPMNGLIEDLPHDYVAQESVIEENRANDFINTFFPESIKKLK